MDFVFTETAQDVMKVRERERRRRRRRRREREETGQDVSQVRRCVR
jgi:hypothetical protein